MAKARQISGVDCDTPAVENIRRVLGLRLEEMCSLRARAIDWNDPEGVHDMRVASRRLRGAARDFQPYLRKRPLSHCLKEIREVAHALGFVRDYDVTRLELEKIAAKAPSEFSNGVRQFAELRQVGLEGARTKLIEVLDAENLAKLRENFVESIRAATDTSVDRRPAARKAPSVPTGETYRQVAGAVIANRLEEFEALARCFQRPLKVKPLHRLRIGAKHLRYALELFEQCWASHSTIKDSADQPTAHSLKFLAGKVAAMQSSLGNLHDADVWIEDFGELSATDLPGLDFDQRATAIWLLSHFIKLRSKHLSKTLMQWNEWETQRFSAQLREAIQPPLPAGSRFQENRILPTVRERLTRSTHSHNGTK